MSADRLNALLFAASLVIAAAGAYMMLQPEDRPLKASLLSVVSPSFISDAKDPRADQYSPVVKSLSGYYGAFFSGGWQPSDEIDAALIEAAKNAYVGKNCNGNGSNTYSKGTISLTAGCCVNTLNQSLNESMPNGMFSAGPEVYRISRYAYDSVTLSALNASIDTRLRNSIAALGGVVTGLSVRISDRGISANLLGNQVDLINEILTASRGQWSSSWNVYCPPCECTDYATNPACINITIPGSPSRLCHVNAPCFVTSYGGVSSPSAPQNLTATQETTTTIRLGWDDPASPHLEKYIIYLDGTGIGAVSYASVTHAPQASFLMDESDTVRLNLTPFGGHFPMGNHYFEVSVINNYTLSSPHSNRAYVNITDTTAPGAPLGFNATRVDPSTNEVNLTWGTPADPDDPVRGYAIYRNGAVINSSVPGTYVSYLDKVPGNGTYYYNISAFDRQPNYGPNASAAITMGNITVLLMPSTREEPAPDLRLGHDWTVNVYITLNRTIRRVTLYKRLLSMFFDVDVDVNYTIGAAPYSESFRKRLTVSPNEIPVASGQPVAARATSATSCRYTYETMEQANILVVKDRANLAGTVNDWFLADVRYTEADTPSACTAPQGVNLSIAYANCLVS